MIDRHEFEAWRLHPVTKIVFGVLAAHVEECKQRWFQESWVSMKFDEKRLPYIRGRADALSQIIDLNYDDVAIAISASDEQNKQRANGAL